MEPRSTERHPIPEVPTHLPDAQPPAAPAPALAPAEKGAMASKTMWGILTFVVGALLTAAGYDGSVTFLQDGLQVQDIYPLLMLAGWVLAKYGQRTAKVPIK